MKKKTTLILAESAMLISMAVVLSQIKVYVFPQGGSVTLASMAPIVLISCRYGAKWGLGAAFVYSLLQMILPPGFYPPPAKTLPAFACVVLLDYVIAFTVLGTAVFFGRPFKNKVLCRCRPLGCSYGAEACLPFFKRHPGLEQLRPGRHARVALFPRIQRYLHAVGDYHHRRRRRRSHPSPGPHRRHAEQGMSEIIKARR